MSGDLQRRRWSEGGAKENANRGRTCRTQGRASVSQAPERVRKAARPAVNIRGGSRMRESRTYGSVRGALSNGRPYRIRHPWWSRGSPRYAIRAEQRVVSEFVSPRPQEGTDANSG